MIHLFTLLAFGLICMHAYAEESTHLPFIPGQKGLDSKIQDFLKLAQPDEYCRKSFNQNYKHATKLVTHSMYNIKRELFQSKADKRTLGSDYAGPIPPCELCMYKNVTEFSIPTDEDARTTGIGDKEFLIDIVGEFKSLKIACEICHLVDDTGKNVTGNFSTVWTGGRVEVVLRAIVKSDDDDAYEILLINATNVDQDTVKMKCSGNKSFKNVCMKAHHSGELDHVYQHTVENLLRSKNPNDYGISKNAALYKLFGMCSG